MLYPQDGEKRSEFVNGMLGKALAEVMPELDQETLFTIDPIMAFASGRAAGSNSLRERLLKTPRFFAAKPLSRFLELCTIAAARFPLARHGRRRLATPC
jgi:hypothetical protein